LVHFARKKGARSVDGLLMLLHQGILAFEIWFGKPAPAELMRRALFAAARR
jgi:shikimate dehydrogenase